MASCVAKLNCGSAASCHWCCLWQKLNFFLHTGINQITYMQITHCIAFMQQRKSNVIGTKLQTHPPSSVNATPCVNALLRQTHNRKCALSARGVSVKVQHCALSTFNYTAQHTGSPLYCSVVFYSVPMLFDSRSCSEWCNQQNHRVVQAIV